MARYAVHIVGEASGWVIKAPTPDAAIARVKPLAARYPGAVELEAREIVEPRDPKTLPSQGA